MGTSARMHINRILVHQVDLPLHEGRYGFADDKAVSVFDTTVVEIETDHGVSGFGEVCPLGPAYLPAYAAGARAGIAELAPQLLGLDPTNLGLFNLEMDRRLKGHPYVKSALDMAAHDILGKLAGLPVAELLGGRYDPDVVLYRAISQDTPDVMTARVAQYRAEGYRRFQLKVGGAVDDDIDRIRAVAACLERGDVLIADANCGWTMHEALRVVAAVADLDVFIEQPCPTYEECLSIRRRTSRPFILDEVMDGMGAVARGLADGAMDVINLKISKVGGLTKARRIRDFAASMGLAMIVEDTWGGDIVTAAIAHLAHSTPPEFLFAATDFNSYVTRDLCIDGPKRVHGRLAAPTKPGLGITPDQDVLGEPVFIATW